MLDIVFCGGGRSRIPADCKPDVYRHGEHVIGLHIVRAGTARMGEETIRVRGPYLGLLPAGRRARRERDDRRPRQSLVSLPQRAVRFGRRPPGRTALAAHRTSPAASAVASTAQRSGAPRPRLIAGRGPRDTPRIPPSSARHGDRCTCGAWRSSCSPPGRRAAARVRPGQAGRTIDARTGCWPRMCSESAARAAARSRTRIAARTARCWARAAAAAAACWPSHWKSMAK
jgi:hypothetical protein